MSDDLRAIAKLLEALRPWREHLVIVGGWAHRLHRFHERAFPPSYQPLEDQGCRYSVVADVTARRGHWRGARVGRFPRRSFWRTHSANYPLQARRRRRRVLCGISRSAPWKWGSEKWPARWYGRERGNRRPEAQTSRSVARPALDSVPRPGRRTVAPPTLTETKALT